MGLQHEDAYDRRCKKDIPKEPKARYTCSGMYRHKMFTTKIGVQQRKNSRTTTNNILITCFLASMLFSRCVLRSLLKSCCFFFFLGERWWYLPFSVTDSTCHLEL